MDLKKIIYAQLKHNSTIVNFILFAIAKTILESIDQLIAEIRALLAKLEGKLSVA